MFLSKEISFAGLVLLCALVLEKSVLSPPSFSPHEFLLFVSAKDQSQRRQRTHRNRHPKNPCDKSLSTRRYRNKLREQHHRNRESEKNLQDEFHRPQFSVFSASDFNARFLFLRAALSPRQELNHRDHRGHRAKNGVGDGNHEWTPIDTNEFAVGSLECGDSRRFGFKPWQFLNHG